MRIGAPWHVMSTSYSVDGDALFGKDGDVAVVGHLSDNHQLYWEVFECVSFCCPFREVVKRQSCDTLAFAGAPICHASSLC